MHLYQKDKIFIRHLGLKLYEPISQAMRDFTSHRNSNTSDEIWLLEHLPVFTQGKTGKSEHLLKSCNIPLVQSDRGGQITYHGPGQQIMYILLNIKRRKIGVRELVILLEQTVIDTLKEYSIESYLRSDAPGVYVEDQKICSLGLRIHKGCSLHGIALNVNMDLSPFSYIKPCGCSNISMTQMSHWNVSLTPEVIYPSLVKHFLILLRNPPYEYVTN